MFHVMGFVCYFIKYVKMTITDNYYSKLYSDPRLAI